MSIKFEQKVRELERVVAGLKPDGALESLEERLAALEKHVAELHERSNTQSRRYNMLQAVLAKVQKNEKTD